MEEYYRNHIKRFNMNIKPLFDKHIKLNVDEIAKLIDHKYARGTLQCILSATKTRTNILFSWREGGESYFSLIDQQEAYKLELKRINNALEFEPDEETLKKCCKCGDILPESLFWKDKSSKDGLQTYCHYCQSKFNIKSRLKNKPNGKTTLEGIE